MSSARDLTRRLAELLRSERSALAEFLLALADFHRDERWRELGHTSLFYFLRRELGLSATAAQQRKTAVELMLDFPDVVEPIRDGRLCLSTVCDARKALTPESWRDVLPRFFGLSHREAEALAAEKIAPLYGVAADAIMVINYPLGRAIKIVVPRRIMSGDPGDRDVYGAQQHTPLLRLEI